LNQTPSCVAASSGSVKAAALLVITASGSPASRKARRPSSTPGKIVEQRPFSIA
jgi:hypothetical protein